MLTYDPLAGTHIARACREAVAMAITQNQPVEFDFNGVSILAEPSSDPVDLEDQFNAKMEARVQAYRESTDGIAEAQKRVSEVERKQQSINSALSALKDIVNDHDKLMLWLKSFAENADDIGVRFDKAKLADEFISAGFCENEHVGQKPDWFSTRPRMAHYIVGQAINCLRHGMGPHPVTASFVEKYFQI